MPHDRFRQVEVSDLLGIASLLKANDLTPMLIGALDLNNERVLSRLCQLIDVRIVVGRADDPQRYILTMPASPDVAGTLPEVAMFMRGYAMAWCEGRQSKRLLIDQAVKALQDKRQDL